MRRIVWLTLVAAVLLGAAWWVFMISPRNAEIDRLEGDVATAEELEQRLRTQIRQLEEIRDREPQYAAAVGALEALIPERPLLDEFIEEVHALSLATGVLLHSLTPALPATFPGEDDLRQVLVTTRIEGEFFQVLGFLFGLHDMERLVRVDAIAVSAGQDEFDRTVLLVTLQLRIFTLADVLPDLEPLVPIDDLDGEGEGNDGGDDQGPDEAGGEEG